MDHGRDDQQFEPALKPIGDRIAGYRYATYHELMTRLRKFNYTNHLVKLFVAAACTLAASYIMFSYQQGHIVAPKSTSLLSPFPAVETELFPNNIVASGPTFLIEGYLANVLVIFVVLETLDVLRRNVQFKK